MSFLKGGKMDFSPVDPQVLFYFSPLHFQSLIWNGKWPCHSYPPSCFMSIMQHKPLYIHCKDRCVIIICSGLGLRRTSAGIGKQILFLILRECHHLRRILWSPMRAGEVSGFARSSQNLSPFIGNKHRAFLLCVGSTLFVKPTNGYPGSLTCPFHKQQLFWWCKTSMNLGMSSLSSLQPQG